MSISIGGGLGLIHETETSCRCRATIPKDNTGFLSITSRMRWKLPVLIRINGKFDGGAGRDQLATYFPRGKLAVKGIEVQSDSYVNQTDAYHDLRIDIGPDVINALRQCLQGYPPNPPTVCSPNWTN